MPATAKKTVRNAEEENRRASAANCACETGPGGRKAIGVDPDLKEANQNRLRRIEGQIRGLQKMVEEDRYCADIIKGRDGSHVRRASRIDLRASAIAAAEQGEITQ